MVSEAPARDLIIPKLSGERITCDVVVVGGGNAGLCAALAARASGSSVALIERAPREWRGGNSKYTRNLRCVGDGRMPRRGSYTGQEFLDDLERVAGGEPFDQELSELLVRESASAVGWMERLGVRWQAALEGTLQLEHTNWFFLGGGKALINHYYALARRLGIDVLYEADVSGFEFHGDSCTGVLVCQDGIEFTVEAGAVVVACGGFEANKAWLAHYWGESVERFSIRGCSFNDGRVVQELLKAGAQAAGAEGAFHATAVDDRSPDYDGGIATRVDSIPLGIVVDRYGRRFYDEGQDLWPKRYAIWGRLVAERSGQAAYSIYDQRAVGQFIPPLYPPVVADTVGALARALGLEPEALERTVTTYNASVAPDANSRYERGRLDGCSTQGLSPEKSNWALPLDSPPFQAYPLRPGITFTYYGLGIDAHARVARDGGGAFANVFAAGEAMAGNILRRGYLAGVGMTIGTVFGRIAGEEAARCARP